MSHDHWHGGLAALFAGSEASAMAYTAIRQLGSTATLDARFWRKAAPEDCSFNNRYKLELK